MPRSRSRCRRRSCRRRRPRRRRPRSTPHAVRSSTSHPSVGYSCIYRIYGGVAKLSDRVKGRRTYDASRRRADADRRRVEVVRAARDLFLAQGYGHTTIADVARAAGVSVETVYAAFGNKATLLHRAWDITVGGDEQDVVFHERPEVRAIR